MGDIAVDMSQGLKTCARALCLLFCWNLVKKKKKKKTKKTKKKRERDIFYRIISPFPPFGAKSLKGHPQSLRILVWLGQEPDIKCSGAIFVSMLRTFFVFPGELNSPYFGASLGVG